MAFINGKYTAFNPEFHVESNALNDLLQGQWTGEDGTFICTANRLKSYAIMNMIGLEKIQLVNAVSIGDSAIYTCEYVQEIIAPKCTEIGSFFIHDCSSLVKLSLPKLNNLDVNCFDGIASNYFDEVTLFTENPFKLSMDANDALWALNGVHLTVAIDTQDADYEDALDKLQNLTFEEITIYDENGELIEL